MPWTLLTKMHESPSFNETLGLFWSTQPAKEDIFNLESFTEEEIELLQAPELKAVIVDHIETHREAFEAFRKEKEGSTVVQAVTWEHYLHVASLLTSRAFTVPVDPLSDVSEERSWLIAGVDMFNCIPPFNVHRDDVAPGEIEIVAIRDIKDGEELSKEYSSQSHRSDVSLLVYGFVLEQEDPLLCSIDLPEFTVDEPWPETEKDDSGFDVLIRADAAAEMSRLLQRLDALPTTEAEDRAQLSKVEGRLGPRGWRTETILRFRIERKRALRHRIRKLRDQLGDL